AGASQGGAWDGTAACGGAGECVEGIQSSTTICRGTNGNPCDLEESCTGTSGACPADDKAPKTTTCTGTSNGGVCDGTDSCDGAGNCVDGFQPSTTICRGTNGNPCDLEESCTGTSGACPADDKAPKTTTCPGTSNGGVCDGTDSCDGAGNCVDGFQPSSPTRRASDLNPCDLEESCTGTSGACPADDKAPKTTTCTG